MSHISVKNFLPQIPELFFFFKYLNRQTCMQILVVGFSKKILTNANKTIQEGNKTCCLQDGIFAHLLL